MIFQILNQQLDENLIATGARCAAGYAGQLDGCGGMRKRVGVTLESDLFDKMGASCNTPWVCLSLCGWALAKSDRGGNAGQLDGCGGMRKRGGVTLA